MPLSHTAMCSVFSCLSPTPSPQLAPMLCWSPTPLPQLAHMLCWSPTPLPQLAPLLCWSPTPSPRLTPMLCWSPTPSPQHAPMLRWSPTPSPQLAQMMCVESMRCAARWCVTGRWRCWHLVASSPWRCACCLSPLFMCDFAPWSDVLSSHRW